MTTTVAVFIFILSVALMSWASVVLTAAIERIGARLRMSEGLLGIVTALGADAPEICAAAVAVFSSNHEVGIGVVIGSNIFNLAGLLGLSAIVAGRVSIGRQGLLLNGGTSMAVSLVVVALVLQWISIWLSFVLMLLLIIPYVVLMALHPPQIAGLKLPLAARRFLDTAVGHAHRDARKRENIRHATWHDGVRVIAAVATIIAMSIGAVKTAIFLGGQLGISHGVIGMVILAALTSIPNVIAAVKLAREGRGAAVISESLNSNTLNILAGICLPALLFGFSTPSPIIVLAVLWLLGMKLVALLVAARPQGLNRNGGIVLVMLYLGFVVIILLS